MNESNRISIVNDLKTVLYYFTNSENIAKQILKGILYSKKSKDIKQFKNIIDFLDGHNDLSEALLNIEKKSQEFFEFVIAKAEELFWSTYTCLNKENFDKLDREFLTDSFFIIPRDVIIEYVLDFAVYKDKKIVKVKKVDSHSDTYFYYVLKIDGNILWKCDTIEDALTCCLFGLNALQRFQHFYDKS